MMPSKIKRGLNKVRFGLNDVLFASGLKRVKTNSACRRILVYHGVVPNAITKINARFISTERFENEIKFYKTFFNVVSLTEYAAGASHDSKPTVALTFDDGYRNNFLHVLPIIEKYNVPATFFITSIRQTGYEYLWPDIIDLNRYTSTSPIIFNGKIFKNSGNKYVNNGQALKALLKNSDWQSKKTLVDEILKKNEFLKKKSLSPYYELMSESEIRQLSSSKNADIGSHGLYHNNLPKISLDDARIELTRSKEWLEDVIQKPVTSLAYPDGDYNIELVHQAELIGYKEQCVLDYFNSEHEDDPRFLNRFGINPFINYKQQMHCIVEGKY